MSTTRIQPETYPFLCPAGPGAGIGTDPYTQTGTFSVPTLEDTIYEGAEQLSVTVDTGSGSALPVTSSSVSVTLTDNDTLMLTGISLTSTPAMGAYYRAGETIGVTAAFNGNVTVDSTDGTPQFGLDPGRGGDDGAASGRVCERHGYAGAGVFLHGGGGR